MTEKEMVMKTVRELPDDCSLDEIADRIEFRAAVQEGLDQLDCGEGIPHDEIKKQLASWLTKTRRTTYAFIKPAERASA
jgi:hypothetical protein